MARLILVLLLGVLAWKAADHHRSKGAHAAEAASPLPVAPATEAAPAQFPASVYRCDGRTMCSQMHSCEEAKYFSQNCPGAKMDGNHDGIPCERQWCTSE